MNNLIISKHKILSLLLMILSFFTNAQTDNAPILTASGRQVFCPGSSINIVTDFTITDSDDTGIAAFFIQISSGYQTGLDRLELIGNHPTITTSWDVTEGKLSFAASNGSEILLADLENAVKEVVFTTAATTISIEKSFSLSTGNLNYLPSTDHFYEFVSDPNVSWDVAKIRAESRTFFGRQGYLATLTSQEEAEFAGSQASGTGWIGGSDEETEGVWKWVTGPEAGTVFWNGQVNGTTPNYAFWNANEPNDFGGNEDYAHITDPSIGNPGSWNDLPLVGGTGPYEPKGYIVEYGAPGDPILNIAVSTSIYIPQITSITNATVCESATATISATPSEGEIYWYDNSQIGSQPPLSVGNDFTVTVTETTTYFASISVNGCITLPRIPVEITVNERPEIINTTNDLICSGTAIISAEASLGEVYWYNSLTSTTPINIGDNYQTPVLTSTTSYFVEANVLGCNSLVRTEVIAEVDDRIPEFDLAKEVYVLCDDIGSVALETRNAQGNYSYRWKKDGGEIPGNTSSINANNTGFYSVSAISIAGCESDEKIIEVKNSETATITKDDVVIRENAIQVINNNLGIGEYEFAIDNSLGPYKEEGFFNDLSLGIHTLFIKDKLGCETAEYEFSILNYPSFFSPNGDGENDVWKIDGFDSAFYTVSNIYIYNRFGILIFTIDANNDSWDGTSNGKKLPNNSYWFKAILTDINGYSIEKIGNFSLIRK